MKNLATTQIRVEAIRRQPADQQHDPAGKTLLYVSNEEDDCK